MKKLEGIIAPMATPLTRDEKIDDKTTRTLVDFLIDGGIDGKCELPLVVYNIPEWTHLFVPPSVIQRLAEKKLIVGMKYTEYNLLNLLRFLKVAGKRIAIFAGSDAMTFTNLEFGGSGGVIGVANVAPKL